MTSTRQNEDADQGVAGLSYSEASAELDAIIAEFEAGVIDVDRLVERLERATAIVDELDRRLRRTRLQVEELVPRLESIGQADADDGDVEILEIVEIDVVEEDGDGEGPTGLF